MSDFLEGFLNAVISLFEAVCEVLSNSWDMLFELFLKQDKDRKK